MRRNVIVPFKIWILFWRAQLDGLPTLENLANKGILLNSTICVLCKEQPESGEHLFVKCKITKEIRKSVNRWWNVLKEDCSSIQEVFGSFMTKNRSSRDEMIKDAIVQAYA